MKTNNDIKEIVRAKYTRIAEEAEKKGGGCSCGCETSDARYADWPLSYEEIKGYYQDADLKLGCGMPTQSARITEGDTVIDLGSGAGNDCFIAAVLTGKTGRVIGLDMSEAMIRKARINAEAVRAGNVEFIHGEIESIPLPDDIADTVISNCVLNLVPDKAKAFAEISRVLKPGGHFSISDIVIKGTMPEELRKDAEMYAGCVSGAVEISEYLGLIRDAGFTRIEILDKVKTQLPDQLIKKYSDQIQIEEFDKEDNGLYSITVYAERP